MPELPEVETLRNQLSDLVIGEKIKDIEILKAKSFIGDKNLAIGASIKSIKRYAKLLVFELSNSLSIAVHLKMSGQLIFRGTRDWELGTSDDPLLKILPNKHTRVIIHFTSGNILYFNDLRIFGWLKIVKNEEVKNLVGKYGPEPFKDLTLEKFKEIFKSSKKPVKIILMDQEKIAGVGNIYANESLFLSKIHPKTPASSLSAKQVELLFDKLLQSLKNGIKYGGASENNFRDVYGHKGKMQEHFLVYGQKGQNCPNKCGGKIQRIALGGRGTFFCPKCQK
jgi:formamidopyrimidine-DNA glycosylase